MTKERASKIIRSYIIKAWFGEPQSPDIRKQFLEAVEILHKKEAR